MKSPPIEPRENRSLWSAEDPDALIEQLRAEVRRLSEESL
jgi:hypothetical protein